MYLAAGASDVAMEDERGRRRPGGCARAAVGRDGRVQAVPHRRPRLAVGRRGVRGPVRAAARRGLRRDLRLDRCDPVGMAPTAAHRPGVVRRRHREAASQRLRQRRLAVRRGVLLRQRAPGARGRRRPRPPSPGERPAEVVPGRLLPSERDAHALAALGIPGHHRATGRSRCTSTPPAPSGTGVAS